MQVNARGPAGPLLLRAARILRAGWCVGGLWLAPWLVQAASLQVAPVGLQFKPQARAEVIWLSNSGAQPLRAQVRVLRWTQADGVDRLEPAVDLVASPPATEIAPGERQLVRIVRMGGPPATEERAYRLLVDELPPAPGEGPRPSGLSFLFRHSLPVFLPPEAPSAPDASGDGSTLRAGWSAVDPQTLVVRNSGTRRVRISALVHVDPQGRRAVLVPGLLGYVLAGQRMRFRLPEAAKALPPGGAFMARFNDEPQEQPLELAPPGA